MEYLLIETTVAGSSCRFMPPITPSTWKTVRSADRFSPVCPQNIPIPPNGPEALLEVPRARLAQLRRLLPLLKNQSEDCLYLNIYVPYETRRQRRKCQYLEIDWVSGTPVICSCYLNAPQTYGIFNQIYTIFDNSFYEFCMYIQLILITGPYTY